MKRNIIRHGLLLVCLWAYFIPEIHAQSLKIKNNKKLIINEVFSDLAFKSYTSQRLDSLIQELWLERDDLLKQQQNDAEQHLDILYYYACRLYDITLFTRGKHSPSGDSWKHLMDAIREKTPLPTLADVERSSWATLYLDVFVNSALTDVFLETRVRGDAYISQLLQQPLDTLKHLAGAYGERILGGFLSAHVLHPELASFYLESHLKKSINNKELVPAKVYFFACKQLSASEPKHLTAYAQQINMLEKSIINARQNPKIVLMDTSEKPKNIVELLAPFHGKVVYLDIWGSWCGPCVEEIRKHVPALKRRFQENPDLVFLYLAMEYPKNRDKWKEFIYLNQLEGQHLVMTDTEIEALWIELLDTKDAFRHYPSYFVFDRNGKLKRSNTYRPSDREKLYLQLDSLLADQMEEHSTTPKENQMQTRDDQSDSH